MTILNEVIFLPSGITAFVQTGCTVLDAALDHGIDLPHECGGNCACTTCIVIVEAGMEHLSPMQEPEEDRLATEGRLTSASRLGCQALIRGGPIIVKLQDEISV